MAITIVIELKVDFGEGAVGQFIISVRGGDPGPVVVVAGDWAFAKLLERRAIDVRLTYSFPIRV